MARRSAASTAASAASSAADRAATAASSAAHALQALAQDPDRLQQLLMRRQVKPRRNTGEDAMSFVGGVILGALIGALIALFLAPTDGPSLRRRIKDELGLSDDDVEPEPPAGGDGMTASAPAVTGLAAATPAS